MDYLDEILNLGFSSQYIKGKHLQNHNSQSYKQSQKKFWKNYTKAL